jgi:hypothetical protein
MSVRTKDVENPPEKATVTLPGTVEKIIHSIDPDEPDKAQIAVEGAEELYREIRIENTLQDEAGNEVCLKKGAEVEVTIAAESEATTPKEDAEPQDLVPGAEQAKGTEQGKEKKKN